ncbi:MAG: PD-(D/E)XK nuclease domain-containing protein [Lachnospiraceae bacterium]
MYLKKHYRVTSNIESGDGRADIMLEALILEYPHIVIEFKQGEDVEKLANDAIQQIEERQYAVDLRGEIILLGVAHNKKKCEIQSKVIRGF